MKPMPENGNELAEVQALLSVASCVHKLGHDTVAEKILKQALRQAEEVAGTDSFLVGQVLLELYDLYDKQGRESEATTMWEWLRKIAVKVEKDVREMDKVPQKWHETWLN